MLKWIRIEKVVLNNWAKLRKGCQSCKVSLSKLHATDEREGGASFGACERRDRSKQHTEEHFVPQGFCHTSWPFRILCCALAMLSIFRTKGSSNQWNLFVFFNMRAFLYIICALKSPTVLASVRCPMQVVLGISLLLNQSPCRKAYAIACGDTPSALSFYYINYHKIFFTDRRCKLDYRSVWVGLKAPKLGH